MCIAILGKVLFVEPPWATVETLGLTYRVNIGLLEDVVEGQYVMVHAGYAIEKSELLEVETWEALVSPVKDSWLKSRNEQDSKELDL
jgi:hydrogenase expression/formation protein HypC